MSGLESFWISYWWIFLLILMVLCCAGMKASRGSGSCGFRPWGRGDREIHPTDSAVDILDKRYALGEISREEYEERRRTLGEGGAQEMG